MLLIRRTRNMNIVLFIINTVFIITNVVLAEKKVKEKEDPKEALKNLGAFFKMMTGNASCEITCPEGLVAIPRKGHVPSSNGCGSMGIKLDTGMFPGFEVCCDKHDKCYDTCNTDRDKCDKDFNECLDNVCKRAKHTQSPDKVKLCENAGGVMQAAATGLGCSSFKSAQQKACECKPSGIGYDNNYDDDDDDNNDDDNDDNDDDNDDDDDDDKEQVNGEATEDDSIEKVEL